MIRSGVGLGGSGDLLRLPTMTASHFGQVEDQEMDVFVRVDKLIKENIHLARLKSQHASMLQYTLPKEMKISDVFELIEKNKDSHRIQDYSLSQTTASLGKKNWTVRGFVKIKK